VSLKRIIDRHSSPSTIGMDSLGVGDAADARDLPTVAQASVFRPPL
jgi:hypothetical protein